MGRICRFFVFLLLSFSSVEGANLVGVFVCDTCAENIESSVVLDLQRMRDEANRIAFYNDLTLKELVFDGEELSPKKFFAALKTLQVEEDDVVLFYFSGHGYRTPSKGGNPWPNLFFSLSKKGVDFLQVNQMLQNKNPRLLVSIADCCNNYLPDESAPPLYRAGSKKKEAKVKVNYQKLFLNTSGNILITSSEVGEYSWCVTSGALFTMAFLKNIAWQTQKADAGKASWQAILDKTSLDVSTFQNPMYVME